MKYLPSIRAILYSLFLLFIYWDSTLWKLSTQILGDDMVRIEYGLFSMMLIIGITIVFAVLFNLTLKIFKKNETYIPKTPKGVYIFLVVLFCFKYFIFGDVGVVLEAEDNIQFCEITDVNPASDCAFKIVNPEVIRESLEINKIGQVKGSNGWYKIYRGICLVQDPVSKKQFVVASDVVSGQHLENQVVNSFVVEEGTILLKNKDIKASEKEDVKRFFGNQNIDWSTNVYSVKQDGFTKFFIYLLFWGVYFIVLIACIILISLSIPDKKEEKKWKKKLKKKKKKAAATN